MLQRSVHAVAVLAMLGVLAGCITPPASPPPIVESVEVSPQLAGPGDTVTVRIEARHREAVFNGVLRALTNPQGSFVPTDDCTSTIEHPGDDLTRATVTIACALPALVSNGTWTLSYSLNYSQLFNPYQPPPPPPSTVTFEVLGGSDDVSPPELVSYSISPEVITRGTPFTVTARVSDDSPIFLGTWRTDSPDLAFMGERFTNWCRNGTLTPVSATEADVVFNCGGGWIGPVGPLTGQATGILWVRDALHNNAQLPLTMVLSPGA